MRGIIVSDQWGQPQQSGDWAMPRDGVQPQPQAQQAMFAPPPVTDSGQFGAPQAQPQPQFQQGFQQQPYGAPQQSFGQQVPYGYPVQQQKQSNGFAVAGFILSLLPLLGLIFSILGLVRSGKVAGKGRVLSIVGLVLSIVFAVVYSLLIANVAKSATALDPGCTTAENRFATLDSQIQADSGNMNSLMGDLTSMQLALQASANQAVHDNVESKLQASSTDLQATIADLKALQAGTSTDSTKLSNDLQAFQTDGTALDTLCSSF
jgi:hypothetical protein